MSHNVFANLRGVAAKSAKGSSICAFPDVCMTPPENPATPPGVPVPYPNTGMASDTTKGTRKVKLKKKEAMIKNKSYFKKSMGDEAGCAAKKGVVTTTNRGKVYFTMWSMNVKFEKSNACRAFDVMTHNHMGAMPGNTPPWPYVDAIDVPSIVVDLPSQVPGSTGSGGGAGGGGGSGSSGGGSDRSGKSGGKGGGGGAKAAGGDGGGGSAATGEAGAKGEKGPAGGKDKTSPPIRSKKKL